MYNNFEQSISVKKRIDFVDLAKGVCIVLVVLYHCQIVIPGFNFIRMPLYFLISGIFFKKYGGFTNFTIKKINKNLIPFLFFYLIGFFMCFLLKKLFPGHQFSGESNQGAFSIWDPVFSRSMFNYFVWFLLALFNANLLFYLIQLTSSNKYIQLCIVIFMTVLGIMLAKYDITLPFYINKTLHYLPFFYFGYILKKTDILYKNKYDKYNFLIFLSLAIIFSLSVLFKLNTYSVIIAYLMCVVGVLAMLFLCKMIGHLPLISYYGRYSIVILGTHGLILPVVRYLLQACLPNMGDLLMHIVLFLIIMILEIPTIYICIKYLGYFTAQKDLITVKY